jgi:hypothetical protein
VEFEADAILNGLGKARRFADPNAPIEARLMAARGGLPLPPVEVAGVLFALTLDPDPEVKQQAHSSLSELPERVLDAVLDQPLHPGLLDLLAHRLEGDERRLEKLALNAASSDETICFLASRPFSSVVDAISHNQTRLLRCEDLLTVLGENPLTGSATIERILEFVGRERGEVPETPSSEPEADPDALEAESTNRAAEPAPVWDVPSELVDEPPEDEPETQAEDRTRSLHSLLLEMSVVEKIKLARFGNSEARGLLVRDRNRIVATAAIRSPKIGENEVLTFAKSRQICDEVLRVIASSREWTRSYPIKHALSTNPKTPIQSAIKFVNYLTDRDLRNLMKSRDVPAPVSQQARRILARKGKV